MGEDKLKLVLACHKSFLAAGDCERIYLLDACPPEWEQYFQPFGKVIMAEKLGKWQSLYCAYDIAKKAQKDVLFLEDDYLWRPDTLEKLKSGLDRYGMVSPYDHPGFYAKHEKTCTEIHVHGQELWRRCPTNTHTFAVKYELFMKYIQHFYYKVNDWIMFTKLGYEGLSLYTPLLSFATHLVDGLLAYDVDWEELAGKYLETNGEGGKENG